MKKITLIFLLLTIAGCAFSQNSSNQNGYSRPDAKERFDKYVSGTFGPTAFVGPVVSATYRQFRKRPEEWEKTGSGFAKRFGDSFGRQFINNSITYGLDEALKLDSHFYPSVKRDFKSKFSNAVISAFTARTPSGKRVIGVPKIVGTYSSAIIADEVWMPNRFNYKDGLRSGTISMGIRVGLNLFREFFRK